MESFFLAETTKYLYLLFDTDNFIHNQGEHGTVINTPNGECIVDAGGYIFNTEAHPIDPSALHCCSEVPNLKLFDINKLDSNRKIFQGDSIEQRRHRMHELVKQSEQKEEKEEIQQEKVELQDGGGTVEPITETDDNSENSDKIQTVSNVESSENESQFSEEVFDSSFKILPEFVNQFLHQNIRPKFDPQLMLERLRTDTKYLRNDTWESNYQSLTCEAQPFLQKMSIMGEFFNS